MKTSREELWQEGCVALRRSEGRRKVKGEITTNGVFVPVLRLPSAATSMMRYGRRADKRGREEREKRREKERIERTTASRYRAHLVKSLFFYVARR